MAELARLPILDDAPRAVTGDRAPRLRTRFYAFLSYSHRDKELADWLHRELEKFRVPHALAGKLTANGVVPRRLIPIFRDQHDLSAGGDLAEEIKAALAASQFLIVLCSPTAAKSRWTNEEIESFKRTRPESCVIAAIAAGEPFASDMPGRSEEECFPPALRYKYDRRGYQTAKRADPLAADFRESGEGRRLAFLKLVAGLLGVGLDELVRRDQTRRQRQLAYLAAASLAGMAVTSTLAVTAIKARDEAREQRRQAEGLVAFMVGDLKDKLEPIGRLDALDGVGSRVLAYYSKQGTSDLTDAALAQRSKALSLMGEIANARGDPTTSLKLYREAMVGTAEAMTRRPSDPEPIFEHAQNVFYVGEIAHDEGDFQTAESSFRDYQRLAKQMIALQPDSMKYRMEQQYADFNLGVVLSDERRFADAKSLFEEALRTMQAIATADPSNKSYQQNISESLTWLADAERALGNFDQAIAHRRRNASAYIDLFARTGDVQYRQHLVPALRALGNLYEDRGQYPAAEEQYRMAIANADALTVVEPNNTVWIDYGIRARIDLARLLLTTGRRMEATNYASAGARSLTALLSHGSPTLDWRKDAVSSDLLQAKLALASGANDEAFDFARKALERARAIHSVDKVGDSFRLVRAYRVLGDAERARGRPRAARDAWSNAFAAISAGPTQTPDELAERAAILRRLGRENEALPMTAKLNSIGYRFDLSAE